jgi:Asp-tRNA(Asn)/Glu-tRNA(Gln) amidotransferase A subunit family amidase
MGSLAQGDVWFKGRTKNPWNPTQGSSGSSAGSSCATAAGLVAFAIGTETLGSIMSPSHQCRVSGLRPTFGRVSRHGAMALSWTMDKVGPICRIVEDCAIVFGSLLGEDPRDDATVEFPFKWQPNLDLKKLKVGFLIGQNDDPKDLSRLEKDEYLKALVELGVKPLPIKFTPVPNGVNIVLRVESAAAFDAFTRSEAIQNLKNSSWPDTFRGNRYVPAVEYLAAQRARRLVMTRFEEELGDVDVVVTNERGGNTLFITNLTGHPQVLVPLKAAENGNQRSCSVIGRLYDEGTALAVAHAIQMKVGPLQERPDSAKW